MGPHSYGLPTPAHSVSQGPPLAPVHYISTVSRRKTRAAPEPEIPSWSRIGRVPPAVPDPPIAFSASFNPQAPHFAPRKPGVVDRRGLGVIVVEDQLDDTPPPDGFKYSFDPTVPPFRPEHIRRLEVTPPPEGGWEVTDPAAAPFRPTLVRNIEATPPLEDVEMSLDADASQDHPTVHFEALPEGYRNDDHGHARSRRDSTPGTDPESTVCEGTKVSESSKVRHLTSSFSDPPSHPPTPSASSTSPTVRH